MGISTFLLRFQFIMRIKRRKYFWKQWNEEKKSEIIKFDGVFILFALRHYILLMYIWTTWEEQFSNSRLSRKMCLLIIYGKIKCFVYFWLTSLVFIFVVVSPFLLGAECYRVFILAMAFILFISTYFIYSFYLILVHLLILFHLLK